MARKGLEQKHSIESFSIAGVTFERRQEVIKALQPNQIVILRREPWNAYDLAAVRVVDLLDQDLGFVPRRNGINQRFTYEMGFGLVASMGPAKESDNYGARVYARPDVPSLLLDPPILPPAQAARFADLASLLGARWAAAQAAVLAAAQNRCEFTGLGQEVLPLKLVPHWRYNLESRTVQMVRLVVMCEPLAAVKARMEEVIGAVALQDDPVATSARLLELQSSEDGQLFTEMNGIADGDALMYFERVRVQCRAMREQQWKVEGLL